MKRLAFSCLAAALVALPACARSGGPQTMRVWGDVSYEGKPVQDGVITFEGSDGAPPAQGPIRNGHFDIPTPAGPVANRPYVVRISALARSGKTVKNIMDETSPTMEIMSETIPSMFNAQSTMKKTISAQPDKNQFSFKLMSSGTYE
jgi:hypothetical protein